jgi:hypothetical protein
VLSDVRVVALGRVDFGTARRVDGGRAGRVDGGRRFTGRVVGRFSYCMPASFGSFVQSPGGTCTYSRCNRQSPLSAMRCLPARMMPRSIIRRIAGSLSLYNVEGKTAQAMCLSYSNRGNSATCPRRGTISRCDHTCRPLRYDTTLPLGPSTDSPSGTRWRMSIAMRYAGSHLPPL